MHTVRIIFYLYDSFLSINTAIIIRRFISRIRHGRRGFRLEKKKKTVRPRGPKILMIRSRKLLCIRMVYERVIRFTIAKLARRNSLHNATRKMLKARLRYTVDIFRVRGVFGK